MFQTALRSEKPHAKATLTLQSFSSHRTKRRHSLWARRYSSPRRKPTMLKLCNFGSPAVFPSALKITKEKPRFIERRVPAPLAHFRCSSRQIPHLVSSMHVHDPAQRRYTLQPGTGKGTTHCRT